MEVKNMHSGICNSLAGARVPRFPCSKFRSTRDTPKRERGDTTQIPAKAGISLFHPSNCHSSEGWNLLNLMKFRLSLFHPSNCHPIIIGSSEGWNLLNS
jgi:hypothetical protein